jgi:hypothetical protein
MKYKLYISHNLYMQAFHSLTTKRNVKYIPLIFSYLGPNMIYQPILLAMNTKT